MHRGQLKLIIPNPNIVVPLHKGWDPIGALILWMGTHFFNFAQSCSLRAFTGTHPVLRGMAHRPAVVRSTFRCLVSRTLRTSF